MAATTFDTLRFTKKLEQAGFTREQAEAQAECIREIMTGQLATKQDISETRQEIRESELRLLKEIEKIKYDLLKWQIGGFIAMGAIMAKGFHWLGF